MIRKYLTGVVGALLFAGLAAVPVYAATKPADESVVLQSSQTHSGLYAKAASRVEIDGVVNGDVIVASSKFILKGTVNGSVYVLAETARFDGVVTGNVHVLASDVEFNGRAASLYSGSSSFVSSKSMTLSSTFAAAASEVEVAGNIGQSAYIAASAVNFKAVSGGGLKVAASIITLGNDAKVGGDLSYSESAKLDIANDKNISGSIKKFATPNAKKPVLYDKLAALLLGVLGSFVLGMVLLRLAPGTMLATADYIQRKPVRALVVGFGFIVLAPIVIVLTLITIVGISVAALGFMAYIAALIVGHVFVALWLGGKLVDRTKGKVAGRNAWALALGLLATGLLELLPVIGGLVAFLSLLAGVGAVVARSWERLAHTSKLQRAS